MHAESSNACSTALVQHTMTDLIMIAWHYTTGQKYKLIKQSGILLPSYIGLLPQEQPILWFSTHQRYEPSAMKPIGDSNGNFIRMPTLDEMRVMGGGLYRLGYPIRQLKSGENLRRAAKLSSFWWRRIAKSGTKLKANPTDWWGHAGSLFLSEITVVETMDVSKRWIPVIDLEGA